MRHYWVFTLFFWAVTKFCQIGIFSNLNREPKIAITKQFQTVFIGFQISTVIFFLQSGCSNNFTFTYFALFRFSPSKESHNLNVHRELNDIVAWGRVLIWPDVITHTAWMMIVRHSQKPIDWVNKNNVSAFFLYNFRLRSRREAMIIARHGVIEISDCVLISSICVWYWYLSGTPVYNRTRFHTFFLSFMPVLSVCLQSVDY